MLASNAPRRRRLAVSLALVAATAGVLRAESPGLLDPTFGSGGVRLVAFDITANGVDYARSLAVTREGSLLSAGATQFNTTGSPPDHDFAVVRLDSTGAPTGLVAAGKATVPFDLPTSSKFDEAAAIALDSQGRIVLGGRAADGDNYSIAIARLTASGSFDSTFAGNALYSISLGYYDRVDAIDADSQDRIVVGATVFDDFILGSPIAYLLRFEESSVDDATALDVSFNTAGYLAIYNFELADALVQPDDKIVAALSPYPGLYGLLARFTESGGADATWGGGDGLLEIDFHPSETQVFLVDAAFDPNGHVVVLGYYFDGGEIWMLARVRPDGTLDPDFGSGGVAPVGAVGFVPAAVAVQSDRKIVISGATANGTTPAAARFAKNGALDTTFSPGGTAGVAEFTFQSGQETAAVPAVAIGGDGRIVIAGSSSDDSTFNINFAFARLQSETIFCDAFEWEGLYGESRWSSVTP